MAAGAKIGHNLAESANLASGFYRLQKLFQRLIVTQGRLSNADLSGNFRLGSKPKTAITALSAILCRE
jgi:hypothetical protein